MSEYRSAFKRSSQAERTERSARFSPAAVTSDDAKSDIRKLLPHAPARAFELLPSIHDETERRAVASLVAQSWARQDISAAWNAVARSPLSATEKQIMFNELWG